MRRISSKELELDRKTVVELERLRTSLENIDATILSSINQYAKFSGYLRHEDLHTRFTK